MRGRRAPCTPGVAQARLRKAEEFWRAGRETAQLADDPPDVADAAGTSFIHAGIAAADVVCCARLDEFSQGEDHRQAIALLRQADAASATALVTLLDLKTKAAYSHVRLTRAELTRTEQASLQLLTTARRLSAS